MKNQQYYFATLVQGEHTGYLLRNNICLHQNSEQLVQDEMNKNKYWLTFKFSCLKQGYITIYFKAKEKLNPITQSTDMIYPINPLQQFQAIQYKVEEGLNQEFCKGIYDLELYTDKLEELAQIGKNQYPLMIILETVSSAEPNQLQNDGDLKNYHYYIFNYDPVLDQFQIKLVKKKIDLFSHSYEISDIFGIDNTSFTKQWNKYYEYICKDAKKECIICYQEKIDTIVMPCKHMCLCNKCSVAVFKSNQKCPVCRGEVQDYLTLTPIQESDAELIIKSTMYQAAEDVSDIYNIDQISPPVSQQQTKYHLNNNNLETFNN